MDYWLGYELPEHLRSAKTGRGQVQLWHIFRLTRADPRVTPGTEFTAYRWTDWDDAIANAVPFRSRSTAKCLTSSAGPRCSAPSRSAGRSGMSEEATSPSAPSRIQMWLGLFNDFLSWFDPGKLALIGLVWNGFLWLTYNEFYEPLGITPTAVGPQLRDYPR